MRAKIAWVIAGLLCAGVLQAAEPVATIDWTAIAEAGRLPDGAELRSDNGRAFLEVRNDTPQRSSLQLVMIDAPGIDGVRWAMRGTVRYEEVSTASYLEMWSVFPNGERYFSRTAAPEGPMAVLRGSSDWREFVLPFTSSPEMPPPTRLELDLVLEGAGTVWIGPIELVEVADGDRPVSLDRGSEPDALTGPRHGTP